MSATANTGKIGRGFGKMQKKKTEAKKMKDRRTRKRATIIATSK